MATKKSLVRDILVQFGTNKSEFLLSVEIGMPAIIEVLISKSKSTIFWTDILRNEKKMQQVLNNS